jgi:hypothetical protein
MSAVSQSVWRFTRARPPAALAATEPQRVVISARQTPDAGSGSIETVDCRDGRIELTLRLTDGSSGAATLFDDGVNSLELRRGATVFVLPPAA